MLRVSVAFSLACSLVACGSDLSCLHGDIENDAGYCVPPPDSGNPVDSGNTLLDAGLRDAGNDAASLPDTAPACTPTMPSTEVCDGVDNDCNGRVDDEAKNECGMPCGSICVVAPALKAIEVAVGGDHVCARYTDGKVRCSGKNAYGQLGNGTLVDSSLPVEVTGLQSAVRLASGQWHTCAVLADGTVSCWGRNDDGRIDTSGTNRMTPVPIAGLAGIADLSASAAMTCAKTPDTQTVDGVTKCWGATIASPRTVANVTGQIVALYSGFESMGALLADKTIIAWNNGLYAGRYAQLQASSVGSGRQFFCFTSPSGDVKCQGNGESGQLGNGTSPVQSSDPVMVTGLGESAVEVAVGVTHACAKLASGRAKCWGSNSAGQLGTSNALPSSSVPVDLDAASIVMLRAGFNRTCVVLSDSSLKCWGGDL